jgi:teichoic acid transport system permease protein
MLKELFKFPGMVISNRALIWKLAKNDFKTRYAGSNFGILWALVQPVIIVLVYWFVFQVGLHAATQKLKEGLEVAFVLWLTSGLVPWFYFSEALTNGTNCLLEYNYLVKKVVFNIDVLPIVKCAAALFIHSFFVVFMLLLNVGYGYFPDLYTLQVIYYSICLFILVLAISYWTSAVVVFFRDLSQIVNIFLQVGIWMTPIMWSLDVLAKYPLLQFLFKLNPLYYIVYGYRDALFYKVAFWERWELSLYFWAVALLLLGSGIYVFKKLKVHFADVL